MIFVAAVLYSSVVHGGASGYLAAMALTNYFRDSDSFQSAHSAIGLLSGLTGVGGGIFLSPLLLLMGWATVKETAGVSAAFISVNSIAGLLGYLTKLLVLPSGLCIWAIAAAAGGWLGAKYGSNKIGSKVLSRFKICNHTM